MSYNPYAAPQVQVLAPPPPVGAPGEPRPWTATEVLSVGWSRIKADGGALVVATFLAQGVAGLPANLPAGLKLLGILRERDAAYWPVFSICSLVGFVLGVWLRGGQIKIWLDAARGRRVEVGDLFKGGEFFAPILGAELLWYLASLVGFMLLVVPGIYVSLGLSMCSTIVVDRRLGAMDSLRESWRLMNGQRLGLFGFYLLGSLLAIGGLLACFVGIMVVMPWLGVAATVIYLRISGQADAVTAAAGP